MTKIIPDIEPFKYDPNFEDNFLSIIEPKMEIQKVNTPPKLAWSENKKPNDNCRYDHCIAKTPFGNFLLTWKSYKEDPNYGFDYGFDDTPWGEAEYGGWSTVDEAKAWAEATFLEKIKECFIN